MWLLPVASVSCQTVARRLRANGLRSRVSSQQIALSEAHKAHRLAYCNNQLENFIEDDWMKTKFSDEKTFRSDMSGRVYICP